MPALKPFGAVLIPLVYLVTGCTSTDYVAPSKYPPKPVISVVTLFQEPTRPYEVIAFEESVAATIFDSPEKLMQRVREKAAAAGADAVIFSSTGKWSGVPGAPGRATARAIKWKH